MEHLKGHSTPLLTGHLNSEVAWVGYPEEEGANSRALLSTAADTLLSQGAKKVIGPLQSSTWNPYRLVTESDASPPFFLESPYMFQDPAPWIDAGFMPRYGYHSTKSPLQDESERIRRAEQRFTENGIRLRTIRRENFDSELRALFTVSLQSFAGNLFYSPCTEEDFLNMYLPYREKIEPEWIRIAESDHGVCGYLFAVPDLLQAQRGETVTDIILKTLAVLPGRNYAGLGSVLVNQVHRSAADRGLTHAIHALMYDGNVSSNIGKDAHIIRRYHLFEKSKASGS